jgi:hypothetical protein
MEDNLACTKSQSFPQTKKSSSNLKSKSSEQNPSSTISKKVKKEEFENEEDLTNKILSNLTYENFESEQEKFYPHYRKKHEEIYINNVPLLDQNRFRFLISSNSSIFNEYTKYEKGNFKNIKWEDIKLVYYYYVEDYQCPICLENKLCCPIIINCGHIFCYPCFLNFYNYYILQNNQKLPKCPLCSEIIDLEKNAIKFCEMIQCKNYTNKMRIKFNLIMREKTSPTLYNLIYDPSLIKWKKSLKNQMNSIPFELSKEFIFSRIFFTNKTLMKERINNMINETKEALKEEKEFYADESKIKSLEQCIEILENIYNESAQEKDFILENVFQKEKNNNIKNKFDNNDIIINNNNAKDNTNNPKDNTNNDNIINNEEEEINYKKYYLFYQEEEGDIYYLDPFIMDILLTEYGDYSNLPVEISGNILDVNMKQITQNIKSNYPYLSHLNLGSIIFFVEIDVNPLISPFTRNKFSHALNERAKRRRLLSNEEKNYEKFINKKSLKEKEEMQNYFLNFNKNIFKQEKKGGENNINNIKFNYKEEINDNNDKEEEEKKGENKKNEDDDKNVKKENMLKKLFEEDKKEKEEEKERLEKERLEKEKKEREKKNIFVFDEKEFPELKNENKEKEKEKENNKGGKKGKKKGKKKFKDIEEDFLIDAFKPEETPKPKWKKSSKHD